MRAPPGVAGVSQGGGESERGGLTAGERMNAGRGWASARADVNGRSGRRAKLISAGSAAHRSHMPISPPGSPACVLHLHSINRIFSVAQILDSSCRPAGGFARLGVQLGAP